MKWWNRFNQYEFCKTPKWVVKCRTKSKEGTPVYLYKINGNQWKTDTSDWKKKYTQIEHGFTRKRLTNHTRNHSHTDNECTWNLTFVLSCVCFLWYENFINFGVISTEKRKRRKKKKWKRKREKQKKNYEKIYKNDN